MNSNPLDREQRPAGTPEHAGIELTVRDHSQSAEVPVFNCLVYVCADPGGGVRARVANLPGLECTAGSEREALAKIVPAFKQSIRELMQSKTPIPWIEPPSPVEPGEQKRFIPVHL